MEKETGKPDSIRSERLKLMNMNCQIKKMSFLAVLFLIILSGISFAQEERNVLFQVSTIGALMEGVFDGDATLGEVQRSGNFGLGTLNGLDGEMVLLDGIFYQIRSDGKVYPVDNTAKTPFFESVTFKAEKSSVVSEALDYKGLQNFMDGLLPTKNLIYALRVTGTFKHMKTRSVAKQKAPYPTLLEATKNQSVFEFEEFSGTMVGFYFPQYMAALNVPGYHFHFLNRDKNAGGHVLDCLVDHVTVEIEPVTDFQMRLLKNDSFYQAQLVQGKPEDLQKAEKDTAHG